MEWATDLIAPIITGLVTLIGLILANRKAVAVREVKEEAREQAYQERLERIESKIDEHNGYAKLFREISENNAITLARYDERLSNLEHKGA